MDDAAILVEGVSEPLKARAYELALNVLWLESRLREIRAEEVPLTVEYDHGGGQKGIKKNPVYDVFAQTFTQYRAGLSQLAELMESGDVKPEAKSKLAELRVLTNDLKMAR